jgi:16S rRNA (guanine527-N7)-methyltransferase
VSSSPPLTEADDRLTSILADAQRLGFLGPGPLPAAMAHSRRFAAAVPTDCRRIVDLGAGGGLPGLVIAEARPELHLVLLDASERRTTWLRRAVARLGLADRTEVVTAQAEVLGRDPAWRGVFDGVVARGFGSPSVTAECAAPLLRVGGTFVVSEPPDDQPSRWDERHLAELGLQGRPSLVGFARFDQVRPCPPRFPRHRPR